jgi:protein TonB
MSVLAHAAAIGAVATFLAHRSDLTEASPEHAIPLVFAPPPADAVKVAVQEAPALDFAPPAEESVTPQPPPIPLVRRPPAPAARKIVAAPVVLRPAVTEAAPTEPLIPARPVAGMESGRPPGYPESARRRGEQGRVVLRVDVSADGLPADVTVAEGSGFPNLDAAALGAVRQWRFVPATRGGTPVAATAQVPIRFRLAN